MSTGMVWLELNNQEASATEARRAANGALSWALGLGIALMVIDGELRFRGRAGALTPELRNALQANREEIVRIVSRGSFYSLARPCENCGSNRFWYEPLAYNLAGGHVCRQCRWTFPA